MGGGESGQGNKDNSVGESKMSSNMFGIDAASTLPAWHLAVKADGTIDLVKYRALVATLKQILRRIK